MMKTASPLVLLGVLLMVKMTEGVAVRHIQDIEMLDMKKRQADTTTAGTGITTKDYNDKKCPKCQSPDLSKEDCQHDRTLNGTCQEDETCYVFELHNTITVDIPNSDPIEMEEIIKCIAKNLEDKIQGCHSLSSECTGNEWSADDPRRGEFDETTDTMAQESSPTTTPPITEGEGEEEKEFTVLHCSTGCNPSAFSFCEGAVMESGTIEYGCDRGCTTDEGCKGQCLTERSCKDKLDEVLAQLPEPDSDNNTPDELPDSSNNTPDELPDSSNNTPDEETPKEDTADYVEGATKKSSGRAITSIMITYLTVTAAWLFY